MVTTVLEPRIVLGGGAFHGTQNPRGGGGGSGGALLRLTRKSPLLQEVPHELGLGEEDIVHLVHAELVHLIDVLLPVQVLLEGLHLSCWTATETSW